MENNEDPRLTDDLFLAFVERTIQQVQSEEFLKNQDPEIAKQKQVILELLNSLQVFFKSLNSIIPLLTPDTKDDVITRMNHAIPTTNVQIDVFSEFQRRIECLYKVYKECFVFAKKGVNRCDVEEFALKLINDNQMQWPILDDIYKHFTFWTLRDLVYKYKTYDDVEVRVAESIKELNTKTNAQKSTVTDLEKRIEKLKTDVAFVELTKAFIALKDKQVSRWRITLAICCVIFATLILTPLSIHWIGDKTKVPSDWFQYVQYVWPFVAVEFFLIYGFRIVYSNLKSTDAQITQLEIRIALCQFVDGYKTFVNNTHDKQPIEKFESLVFSGLSMDASDIPTTFDGLDQVSKIVEAFKSTKT